MAERAGELKIEITADPAKFKAAMEKTARDAVREAKKIAAQVRAETVNMFGETTTRRNLQEAAAMEAQAGGVLQQRGGGGMSALERFRGGLGAVARAGGVAAAAGAAAYGGFRAGNAIERVLNAPAARREEERIRREDLTDRLQAEFRNRSLANLPNLTPIEATRQTFRTQRADLVAQREAEIRQRLQPETLAQAYLSTAMGRAASKFTRFGTFGLADLDRFFFDKSDVDLARESGLPLGDVRQNRIRGEERKLTQSQIQTLRDEEKAEIEAQLRAAFPALQAQFNARAFVEINRELVRLNEQTNTNLGTRE